MKTRITTQRLSVGGILSEGWRLYRASFSRILPVILLVSFPKNVMLALIPFDSLAQNYGLRVLQLQQTSARLLELLIGSIATMAIAYLIEGAIRGQGVTWQESLRHGLTRWASAIGTGLLAGIIVLGLTLLLIVPGIVWSQYYAFGAYVVALRGIGGKAALDYSKKLVKGQWWRVVGIELAISIPVSLAVLVIGLVFAFVSSSRVVDIISYTIADILGVLYTIVLLVLFLNTDYLRNRPRAKG